MRDSQLPNQVDVSTDPICFNITLTSGTFVSEINWSIATCKSSQTYSSNNKISEQCCLAPGEYNLTCKDTWGDGWQEEFLEIQGKRYCDNFKTGSAVSEKVKFSTLMKGTIKMTVKTTKGVFA